MDRPRALNRKPKRKYYVFARSNPHAELDEGAYEGMTWAVSEKQAINNIRHNNYGDNTSQHKDGYFWSAVLAD